MKAGDGLDWFDPKATVNSAKPAAQPVAPAVAARPPPPAAANKAQTDPAVTGANAKIVASGDAIAAEEVKSSPPDPPQPPPPPAAPADGTSEAKDPVPATEPAKKELNVIEVQRTVDAAVKAKELLAQQSILKAKEDMEKRKAEMQARYAEEERRIEEEEKRLAKLQDELKTGLSEIEKGRVKELRALIEGVGREVSGLEHEVATRKLAMQRATDLYVESEEKLASKRAERKKLEEEMLDIILATGKAKDEKLNQVLSSVPDSKAVPAEQPTAGSDGASTLQAENNSASSS